MDKFITFMETTMVKQKNLTQLEQYCVDSFRTVLMRLSPSLTQTINLNDVCQELYQKFLTENIQIACLIFSDGNKIYLDKQILKRITFFNNYFDDNDYNDIIIDLPMSDVIDDYDTMRHLVKFIYDGGENPTYFFDYKLMYKMVKVNDYLLDVTSLEIENKKFKIITLRKHIEYSLNVLLTSLSKKYVVYEYNDNCLDMLYETYVLLKLSYKMHVYIGSTLHKNKDTILNSPLAKILVFPGQKIDI
jgi:hypothetical protein